jgi:hypothetical protein
MNFGPLSIFEVFYKICHLLFIIICNYLGGARFARTKGGMWFIFRALPEKRTTSPLFLRAKRAKRR